MDRPCGVWVGMDPSAGLPLVVDAGSRRHKLLGGVAMLLLATGLGFLAPRFGFFAGMGAVIFGIAGLSLFLTSFGFSGKGPCPTCGAELTDVPREVEGVYCKGCSSMVLVRDAKLFVTPKDYVAKHGIYPVKVEPGTQPDFRGMCACCGKPATSEFPRELSVTVVGAPGVGRIVKTWKIGVAVCGEHVTPDSLGNPKGVISFQGNLSIASHAAWQAMRKRP